MTPEQLAVWLDDSYEPNQEAAARLLEALISGHALLSELGLIGTDGSLTNTGRELRDALQVEQDRDSFQFLFDKASFGYLIDT